MTNNTEKYERAWKRLYYRFGHISADAIADFKVMYDLIGLYKETRKKLDITLFILASNPSLPVDMKLDKEEWERWLEDEI